MDMGSQIYQQYSHFTKYLNKKRRFFTFYVNMIRGGTQRFNIKSILRRFLSGFILFIFLFTIMYTPLFFRASKGPSAGYNIIGWRNGANRNPTRYIRPKEETTIHEPKLDFCDKENTDKKQKLLLIIIVCSATNNFAKRNSVRETWGNYNTYLKIYEIMNSVREKYKNYDSYRGTFDKLDDVNIDYLTKYIKQKRYIRKKDLLDEFERFKTSFEKKTPEKKLSVEHKRSKPCMKKKDNQKLNNFQSNFRIVFLVGKRPNYGPKGNNILQNKIDEEAKRYGDIIQEDILDCYSNVTLKSIMMLKWITNKCKSKVRYFMKTDDDAYINVPKLVTKLHETAINFDKNIDQEKKENLLIGALMKGTKPIRDYVKYYTPQYMYNKRFYPPYLSGAGYVFSMDTANALYKAALVTDYIHLEDVFITGLCAARADPPIMPKRDPDFSTVAVNLSNYCLTHSIINTHYVKFRHQMQGLEQQLLQPEVQDMCERKSRMNIKTKTSTSPLFSYIKRFLRIS